MFIKFHQPYSYCYFYFTNILDRKDWLQSIYSQLYEGTPHTHHIYKLLWVIGGDIGQKQLPTPSAMIIICMLCINLVIYFENLPVLPYR